MYLSVLILAGKNYFLIGILIYFFILFHVVVVHGNSINGESYGTLLVG